VGAAGGLALTAVASLILFCTMPRRAASPAAAVSVPAQEGFTDPQPNYAAMVDSEPAPVAAAPIPAAPEPGTAKPASGAPPTDVRPGSGPAGFAKSYSELPPLRIKHRDLLSADELRRQLLAAPELDLDAEPGTSTRVLAAARQGNARFTHPILEPLLKRADLRGLPVAMGADCQLGRESAQNLQVLSRQLRAHLAQSLPRDGIDIRWDAAALRKRLIDGRLDGAGPSAANVDSWRQEDALPTMVQMLQAEDRPVRLVLVELLARIPGRAASAALANRALFDLSDAVREEAVRALAKRPRDEYRSLLLDGLRYPWAPAADHAAEALVALGDRASNPQLLALLDEPDPAGPVVRTYREVDPALLGPAPRPRGPWPAAVVAMDERPGAARAASLLDEPNDRVRPDPATAREVYVVREVVRVNHLRNCLLCHAAATAATDPVRGLVPTPGQPLPAPFSTPYYEGQEGRNGIFVRADVTYVRQDFSVPQPVAKAGTWPAYQRYDYVVRMRYPTEEELQRTGSRTYPQREAVRWALRELGGG
jgi:hypothetical protein